MSFKKKQEGFTIVELLIVIVVIGILAALVITTFTGIQQQARNTERETDIKAIHGQLEAYYAQEGFYPTLGNMNDAAWRAANMKGLDDEALADPKYNGASPNTLVQTEAAGDNQYTYDVTPAGCDNDPAVAGECTGYTLQAEGEDGKSYSQDALN